MQNTSTKKALVAIGAAVVIGSGGLVGCGEATADSAAVKSAATLKQEAEILHQKAMVYAKARAYPGDPWEKRLRESFWADQHIHDSGKIEVALGAALALRCHPGENVPKVRKGGRGC